MMCWSMDSLGESEEMMESWEKVRNKQIEEYIDWSIASCFRKKCVLIYYNLYILISSYRLLNLKHSQIIQKKYI